VSGATRLRTSITTAAILLAAAAAFGDGGLVRVSERSGPFVVTVFTAPTPLRVGGADVSVLVQTADDRSAVLDAEVEIVARASGVELRAPATRGAATNKLLYAAIITFPTPGAWALAAHVRRGESVAVSCEVSVEPPQAAVIAYWPYFAAPALIVAVFALHQWLAARTRPQQHRIV